MKRYHQLTQDMLARVLQYKEDHPINLAIARAHALFARLATFLASYATLSGAQAFGRGGYRAGASERQYLAQSIRRTLLDMSATARGLEPLHPGISEQFRLGRQASSHQRLLATAHSFLKAIEPPKMKQLFTDRAFLPDFDTQLAAKTEMLAEAVGRKASGLQEQKRGTEGMAALSREVNATMRELRALMEVYLRDSNPVLFEVWKAAARIYRGSERVSVPREEVVATSERVVNVHPGKIPSLQEQTLWTSTPPQPPDRGPSAAASSIKSKVHFSVPLQ